MSPDLLVGGVVLVVVLATAWAVSRRSRRASRPAGRGSSIAAAAPRRDPLSPTQLGAIHVAIVESAVDCIITIDHLGCVVEFNPAAERAFGYVRADVIGRPLDELIVPERFRAAHRAGMRRYLTTGEGPILGRRIELVAVRSDGSEFPTELTVTHVDVPGSPLFTAYLRDLTEQHRAQAALAESERRLQTILDNSPVSVSMKDLAGTYVFANRRCVEAFGIPHDEIIGRPAEDLWPPAVAAARRRIDDEVIHTREPVQVEHTIGDGDSARTHLAVTFPMIGADGEVYGTSRISTDITERTRSEAERVSLQGRLHQSQRLESLGQLAGGVAHDFNNLLAVILNYASFVAERTSGTVRADVDKISEAAERAARLTHQLLVFARRETVRPQHLDLNEVVESVRVLLSRTIGEDIELRVRVEPDLPTILADRGQIDQVLLNLAVNARDAMPDGGTLTLETRGVDLDDEYARLHPETQPGPYVQLIVSDTGTGMTPAVAARAFEPFFSTKPAGRGTGLGLATVYGIVTEAGGGVLVDSKEGIGTTFRVNLPRSDVVVESIVEPAGDRWVPWGDETILVVEDEPAMLEVTARLLTRNGYRVLAASSAAMAVELATANEFHLLLTDSVMPNMSGTTLTELLKRRRPELAVLFMSGYSQGVLGPRRLLADDVRLIQKPFTESELLAKVREALRPDG